MAAAGFKSSQTGGFLAVLVAMKPHAWCKQVAHKMYKLLGVARFLNHHHLFPLERKQKAMQAAVQCPLSYSLISKEMSALCIWLKWGVLSFRCPVGEEKKISKLMDGAFEHSILWLSSQQETEWMNRDALKSHLRTYCTSWQFAWKMFSRINRSKNGSLLTLTVCLPLLALMPLIQSKTTLFWLASCCNTATVGKELGQQHDSHNHLNWMLWCFWNGFIIPLKNGKNDSTAQL